MDVTLSSSNSGMAALNLTPPYPATLSEKPSLSALSASHFVSESSSLLLDIIRFSAAILVVIAHLGHTEFNTRLGDYQILGDIAVPIFFVLSGFVIRFVTRSREHTLPVFLVDRASRIYSIVLPAMALTLSLSGICYTLAPQYYLYNWGEVSRQPFARIFLNLIFLSQSWGHNTIPFIDSPFWSLSYECLYYVAYGLIFFLRGGRRVAALVVWAALAGPQVIFLLPIWWLGCWIYDLHHILRNTRIAAVIRNAALMYVALALSLAAFGRYALLTAVVGADLALIRLPNPLIWLHLEPRRATLFALGTGVLAGAFLLILLFFSDLIRIAPGNPWVRRVRRIADGTFAIYLMHYPLMVLATTLGFFGPNNPALNIFTAAEICTLLILVAAPLDRLKVQMRSFFRRLFLAPSH